MRHIQTIDPDRLGDQPLWLAGGGQSDACGIRAALLSPEADSRSLVSCDVDRLFFVVRGQIGVQMNYEKLIADERSVVLVEAGKSHNVWGEGGHALILDIFAPTWPRGGLVTADARADSNSSTALRRADPAKFEGEGFAAQTLAERRSGSAHIKLNLLRVAPGSGSPDWHIHAFDQCYFILEGEMHIDIGKARVVAPPLSFVVLPAGVVHRNWNPGPTVESHISLLVPEPQPGQIFDYAVDIREHEAELLKELPAA